MLTRETDLIAHNHFLQLVLDGRTTMPDLKEPTLETKLEELRASDDPRVHPEHPYTPEWEHLADIWPEEVKARDGGPYRVEWKEERSGLGQVRSTVETPSLLKARKAAQRVSLMEGVPVSWVTLPEGPVEHDLHRSSGQDRDTVDVWSSGFRLPNHHWTKEGHPPHRPSDPA